MDIRESAKVVLAGEHSRRRGYLNRIITTWNQIAISTVVAIWAIIVDWNLFLDRAINQELFCIQIAWAGFLSSIMIALWRLSAHSDDHDIIRLYPVIYLSECALLPTEIHTIKNPKDGPTLTYENIINNEIEYVEVKNKEFGNRGHLFFDILAITLILSFFFLTLIISTSNNLIQFSFSGRIHTIGYLLILTLFNILIVVLAFYKWRNKKNNWPVPSLSKIEQRMNENVRLDENTE